MIKIFLLLFFFFHLLYANITAEVEQLEKKFYQGSYDDIIIAGEDLQEKYFNDLALREILLKTYLEKNYLEQAKEELVFIKKWENSLRAEYLEALVLFYEKNYAASLQQAEEILREDSNYRDAHLLKIKIFLKQNKNILASNGLQEYETIAGRDANWYELQGTLLLNSNNPNTREIKNLLEEYKNRYPKNHYFFFLETEFFLLVNSPKKALASINQALFLNKNYFPYVKKKLEIYFITKNWNTLLNFLKQLSLTEESIGNEEFSFYKRLTSFVQFFIYKKVDDFFELKNKENLTKVILPLEELLLKQESDEWARYFLEEIILANTAIDDPLRERYASYHKTQSKLLEQKGNYLGVFNHVKRGISLTPLDEDLRIAYVSYLKNQGRNQDYLEELGIVKNILENQQKDTFKITTQIEFLTKELRSSLANTLANNFAPSHGVKFYILVENQNLVDEFTFPYFNVVVGKMLFDKLQESFILKAELVLARDKKKILQENNLYQNHFLIDYQPRDREELFLLQFQVSESGKEVKNVTLSARGNSRYQEVLNQFKTNIEKDVIPQGEVVEITSNLVVISLGELQGIKENDTLVIKREENILGEITISQVENYFASAQIFDYQLINVLKKGDVVQLAPPQ